MAHLTKQTRYTQQQLSKSYENTRDLQQPDHPKGKAKFRLGTDFPVTRI